MADREWLEGVVREALTKHASMVWKYNEEAAPKAAAGSMDAGMAVARAVAAAVVRELLDAYDNKPYPSDDVAGTYVALRSGLVGRASELGLTGEREAVRHELRDMVSSLP